MEENNNNNNLIIIDTTTDRISQLPECILHHILSFSNSPVQLVRMSVLSKNWFALMASFPILEFSFYEFMRAIGTSRITLDMNENTRDVRDKFFKYVDYTTSRFCNQNGIAHTFKLVANPQSPTEVDITNRCIRLILKKGVQVLMIGISKMHYRLPNILLSASSLTSLTICGCELPYSLMTDVVNFKSLKLLYLIEVPLSEEVIKRLTNSCPLLKEFNVKDCYGFKRFCLYGLQNLHTVLLCYKHEVEKIDIDAPNLYHLFLVNWVRSEEPSMNLASCKKLTTLIYEGCSYPMFTLHRLS